MLAYLLQHEDLLKKIDAHAPNRLLFDALAFCSLGKLLDDRRSLDVASSFVSKAMNFIHGDGYVIEGGPHDSSYNGVASALAFRLATMGKREPLGKIATDAIRWQTGRISTTGEISTVGNTPVGRNSNEEFPGRKKDVDVTHTVETLILATLYSGVPNHAKMARTVISHYERARRK